MVAVPDKPVMSPEQAMDALKLWYEVSEKLSKIKTQEVLLRKQMADYFVPDAVEGTNRVDIGDGFDLILTHKINRTVDEDLLDNALKDLRKAKIKCDELFPYKPSLSLSEYRKLTDEQRAMVDAVLDISVGTPQLDIGKKPEDNSKYTGGVLPGGIPGVDTSIVHPEKDTNGPTKVEMGDGEEIVTTYVMTPLCDGVEYDTFIKAGWTDEQLIEHGYMVAQEPAGDGLPPKPKPKRKSRKKTDRSE